MGEIMKSLKKFFLLCLCSVIFILPTFAASSSSQNLEFAPTSENVKFLGRSYLEKDVLWMCFSGTGAAFNIEANHLEVQISGDSGAKLRKDNGSAARIVVFVNGERKLDEMILKQSQNFVVFDGTETVKGEVQIVKVSESANSIAGISKIITDANGKISPTEQKNLKIEFIGDSITCGYGVDDLDKNHHFATSTEDNTKTYAYKTAQMLNADYSMVSLSGWGVVSGYTSGSKNEDSVLPKVYDKIGFTWGTTFNGKQPQSIKWDFSKFVPDFVVINLGTNDDSYVRGDQKKKQEFEKSYIEFLKDIRKKNPDAKIVCTLGIMGDNLFSSIENAVLEYSNQTDDKNVFALRFAPQQASDGIAADWHPSEKTHEKAANLLTSKIKELE